MKIVAYAARRYEVATRKSIGGGQRLLTCPPFYDGNLDPFSFYGFDLAVFNLHGQPGQSVWFGGDGPQDGVPALKASTLRRLPLKGAGVFAVNCYLGDDDSPMRSALREAGAQWVIGGAGINFGGLVQPMGADVLLLWFVRLLGLLPNLTPEKALALSKWATKAVSSRQTAALKKALADTLEFNLWRF